jgi:hypothetical protein
MEPLLTLVIALGGIATGIGAIWAALVARRQAQATQRSLAQTERSLAEQNERARLTLEFDLLSRLADQAINPYYQRMRRQAAKYLLDNAFVVDGVGEVSSMPLALFETWDSFEEVGDLLRRGVLSAEPVWIRYGHEAAAYWLVGKPIIEKMREEFEDPTLYEGFEYLCRVSADIDRKRGISAPTHDRARQTLEWEATRDEEPPTTTE